MFFLSFHFKTCSSTMLLSPSFSTLIKPLKPRYGMYPRVPSPSSSTIKVLAMAKGTSNDTEDVGIAGTAAIVGGLISTPVIGWSLYTLKTTGCGLPPGPGGSLGALEGVSFLAVFGIVGWSLFTKAKTGSGLPNGPFGLLGAVEGLSYLSLLAILVVFGLQYLQNGSIPGPLPGEQCFG